MFLNHFFHLNPMSALTHTCENSVKCPMANWSWTGQNATLKKKQKQKTQLGDFFFHFFNLSIFVSLEMFTIHVLRRCYKKMEWIYLNQGEIVGVCHLRFCFTRFSLIYFSDTYINAKYKQPYQFWLMCCPAWFCHATSQISFFLYHT